MNPGSQTIQFTHIKPLNFTNDPKGKGWSRLFGDLEDPVSLALAGVAQWIKCCPVNQRHMPGLWAMSLVGDVTEATTH